MRQGTLVLSSNRGRYAVCTTGSVEFDGVIYPELTSGTMIEIFIGRQWIKGSIEHGPMYASELVPARHAHGYYFVANDGGVIGLCVGMKVRTPS